MMHVINIHHWLDEEVKSLFLCECLNGDHRELLVGVHAAAA
jgi:hypothetical protein